MTYIYNASRLSLKYDSILHRKSHPFTWFIQYILKRWFLKITYMHTQKISHHFCIWKRNDLLAFKFHSWFLQHYSCEISLVITFKCLWREKKNEAKRSRVFASYRKFFCWRYFLITNLNGDSKETISKYFKMGTVFSCSSPKYSVTGSIEETYK